MVIKKLNKTGQSFSTDLVVVVVLVLFGTLFLVLSQINNVENGPSLEEKYEKASLDAKLVVDNLRNDNILDDENKVNVEKLLAINEEELKEELGITGDFAIVFEKEGKLVKIDPENNVNCIGSQNIIVNGVSCK